MRASRVAIVESASKRHSKWSESLSNDTVGLKLAERPVRGRVQLLADLASSLMREAQSLARDEAFTAESTRFTTLNIEAGVDFYDEVRRFETGLIKLALEHAEGNQSRAAKLLGIRATTLNTKIKILKIEY